MGNKTLDKLALSALGVFLATNMLEKKAERQAVQLALDVF